MCACGRHMKKLDGRAKVWHCSTKFDVGKGYGYSCGGTEILPVKDARELQVRTRKQQRDGQPSLCGSVCV